MPFVILLIGIWLAVAAFLGDNNLKKLGHLLRGDFTGPGNFVWWIGAIMIIGGIGFVPGLKKFSDAFLFLVLLVLFIANRGFFAQFTQALNTTSNPPPLPSDNTQSSGSSGGGLGSLGITDIFSGGSQSGGGIGLNAQTAMTAGELFLMA